MDENVEPAAETPPILRSRGWQKGKPRGPRAKAAEFDLAEDDEPAEAPPPTPRAKPPAQRTVRVRLLKAYWPGDGREHPDAANRISGRKHRFDAGEIIDLPVEEARRLLDEQIEKRTVRVWDSRTRRWVGQDDSLRRPPAAVRANAYSVEDDA